MNPALLIRITPYGLPSKGAIYEQPIPLDPEERRTYALRIVAQRCLYGVDKNPLAVEMAKLSLWRLTLAKDKPFEFLDHAIRCGDSLVGIHNLDQLRKFNLEGNGENNSLFLQFLDPKIKEAIILRRQITEMQANTVEEVEAQDRLLREANEKIDRLRCAADMLVGAEFLRWDQAEFIKEELEDEEREDGDDQTWQPAWKKVKNESAQFRHAARIKAAIEVAVHFHDSDLATFQDECAMWLNGQTPFHWPLEFPEVIVERDGFDVFVGNPPFVGGTRISSQEGRHYIDWLISQYRNGGNRTDYIAYFFQRAIYLLNQNGAEGFIASNSISETDTRSASLDVLISIGARIFRAEPEKRWPGSANVTISVVHVKKAGWCGMCLLSGVEAIEISSYLTPVALHEQSVDPFTIQSTIGVCGLGSKPNGSGFVLAKDEAMDLLRRDPNLSQVIRPYLTADDVTSELDCSPSRWIISFGERPMTECESAWPFAFALVVERVRPKRISDTDRVRREKWWQFERHAKDVHEAILVLSRCLVTPETAKFLIFAWQPTSLVFGNSLNVVATTDDAAFAVLQSSIHETFARRPGLSRLEDRPRYNAAKCYRTFPFPGLSKKLRDAGSFYHDLRQRICLQSQSGLTVTYNRFHDAEETSPEMRNLRQRHVEMDNAVVAAYGWTGLNLGHGFHKTKQGVRYTINESARRDVLARLLKLNHERYAEELRQGLHEPKGKRSAGVGKRNLKKATSTATSDVMALSLFDTAFPSTDRDKFLCGLLCDLVAAQPGSLSTAYLDAMVIALRDKRHGGLLIGDDKSQFATLAGVLPVPSGGSGVEGINFSIKRGESLSGEAYETLAVLLADVALLFESNAPHVHHPGILLHDSPREADLNIRIYQKLLDMAHAYMEQSGMNGEVPYQYIVTTTTTPSKQLQRKAITKLKLSGGSGSLFGRQLQGPGPSRPTPTLFDMEGDE